MGQALSEGTNLCPVQLSISINGLQFKINMRLYASNADFEKAMSGKSGTKEVKELRSEISKYISKAEAILEKCRMLQGSLSSAFQIGS